MTALFRIPGIIRRHFRLKTSIGTGLCLVFLLSASGWTDQKAVFHDIYLTQERICKACTAQWLNNHQVRLLNRQGEAAIVEGKEIIGVDNHPIVRKIFLQSLKDTGLPAKVIVPYAFEDAKDFVCKYCDP